ncbi:MAG: insulinase family protein [Gemmatimonadota bacterium]|nr:insulinase family protein [Gemmatimonadota bacterium]
MATRLPDRVRRAAATAAVILASVPPLAAQQPSLPGIVRDASVEGITAYHLPSNGLTVLFYPDQTKPQTLVNVTYLVGSREEGPGELGMAHLLEHLMVKGTPDHPDIAKELESRGVQYNASTSFDRTNYFELFSAADSMLDWALKMEADRMVHSRIAKADLDAEMTVVRNEFESGENNPTLVTIKRVLGSAYLFHPYGRLPIGDRSDIEHVPIERLQAFYRRYYQPDNAVLMIAGKFDTTRALLMVRKYFGAVARPTRVLEPVYTVEPTQDGEREVWVRRVGAEQDIAAFYHTPAGSSPDDAAIDVLEHVLTDAPSGRLYRALVETRKAASVGVLPLELHDPGGMMFIATLKKEDTLAVARAAMLDALRQISTTEPPTAAEVDRAKGAIASHYALALANTAGIGLALSDWMGVGDWRLFFLHRDEVKKVTPADVQRVAAAYLKPSNRTLGFFVPTDHPDRAEIPPAPDVARLVAGYRGEAVTEAGEAFDPSPANILAHTAQFTTRAGLSVALVAKKTRNASVNAVITLRFGSERTLQHRGDAVQVAGSMLMRGTTLHTRQQLTDLLNTLKSRMTAGGSGPFVTVSIQSTRENLPAVLSLADEVLRHPSFDSTEFSALVDEMVAQFESQSKEPTTLAFLGLQRRLTPYPEGDPRYVGTVAEDIATLKTMKLADVRKAYDDFFGAGAGQIAVVGDFDTTAVRAQLDTMFAGWKSRSPYTPMVNRLFAVTASRDTIDTPDKANAMFVAGTAFPMSDHDPDYAAMSLANYMLGGGALTSRLTERIRVKDGLSYATQSVFAADPRVEAAQLIALAIHAPQNGPRVIADFFDVIDSTRAAGFTADELAKAKTGLEQLHRLARSSDAALANQLTADMLLGRTIQFQADEDARLQQTTLDQVNAAFRKYVDPSRFAVVWAGDTSKLKAPAPPRPAR